MRIRSLRVHACVLGTLVMLAGGCTVYEVAPAVYSTTAPSPAARFDRSWEAVMGAMQDQGVPTTSADRSAGIVRGSRGRIEIVATVRTQADGSIRVQFDSSGATSEDPGLLDRVSSAYERRMGR